jgi:hypothetical protein
MERPAFTITPLELALWLVINGTLTQDIDEHAQGAAALEQAKKMCAAVGISLDKNQRSKVG